MKTFYILKNLLLMAGFLFTVQLIAQFPNDYRGIGEIVKNDFLINDDTESDLLQQEPSQLARNDNGDFVVVWRDERNGDFDIFFQRYNASGIKQGQNTRVNDDAAEAQQDEPAIDIDAEGNFVVTWSDKRNGYFDQYMQLFSADGTPQGPNIMVNDDQEDKDYYNSNGGVGMGVNGEFVIVWNDTRNDGNYDIWGQRYLADGTPQGVNFKVNSEGETNWGSNPPDAGVDQDGNFVICWDDDRYNGIYNIMAQRYNSNGTPQGANFLVNDTSDLWNSSKRRSRMAMMKNGEFVIGWEDFRSFEFPDIYAQRFNSSGDPVGSNFLVTEEIDGRNPENLDVAMNETGNMVFTWFDTGDDFWGDVFAQQYDAAGIAVGNNYKIDDTDGLGIQIYPSVGLKGDSEMVFTYCEDHGNSQIVGIRYNWNGEIIQNSWTVNDDVGVGIQDWPATDINSKGEFVTAWHDNRDGLFNDIFVQLYNKEGEPVGANTKVNDDASLEAQHYPDVAISENGNYVVTWTDERNNYSSDVYAQLYLASGRVKNPNFKVNEGIGDWNYSGGVVMDGDGNFMIIWSDDRGGDNDVYAQRYMADGTPIGGNYQVNEPQSRSQSMADIAMNKSGRHVIVWADDRIYRRRIFARIYEPDGTPVTDNFNCSELTTLIYQETPVVAMDENGNFVVAWYDQRNWETNDDPDDIYARFFNADGTPQGPEFKVNDDANNNKQVFPSVTMAPEGGSALIGWTDYRKENGDPDFMAQLFSSAEPIGNNVIINMPDWFPSMHQKSYSHALSSNNNLVCYTWADNRRHKGWDTYGKLTDWGLVDIEENVVTGDFMLFPNPATLVCNLQLAISSWQSNTIKVIDLNGRILLEQQIPFGTEKVDLDVSHLPSGVYFCRLSSANHSTTKKLIIQK